MDTTRTLSKHPTALRASDRPRVRQTASRVIAAIALLLLGLCTGVRAEDAWWDGAWTMRKKVTVDTTAAGAGITEPVGGATVLLRFFDANYPAGSKEDLSDIRFIAADGKTVLPFHIEKIDPLMGEAFAWVKLPDVKPNAKTTFWIYYGSNDAKAGKAEDVSGTFDADTVAVFHFGESGQAPSDSTKNANLTDGPGGKVDGAIAGGGIAFNGRTLVSIAPAPSLLWTNGAPVTLSTWVKLGQPTGVILSRRDGERSFVLGADGGRIYAEVSGQPRGIASQALQPGAWAHVAVVAEAGKVTLFVNGEASAAIAAGLPALNTAIVLGGDKAPGATGFTGELDELQIHKVARPVGWVQLAAHGQGGEKGPKTIQVGDEEKPTNWLSWLTTGYFGVIIKNLTFDGWAVIVILFVMAIISWYVMVSKVRYLNGISKGNEIFMEQWRQVASDLTVLDDGDEENSRTLGGRVTKAMFQKLKRSSVYRIYHIGVEEIRHRISSDREQGVRRGLAGRSIQAIRAALDGGLVRETQKINKLVVLLTICISGGPFLGLLGTVIGVMITFAAVAAAGDVNVNAIAPGIAAALLATVAGLAVAIPALFGYNYILSRVKDAKDDMHIFIDEFVTKMAEFYKEKGE